jgi:hypothetical protein
MKFANEIDVSVARDAAFAFVADQRNIPLWNYYVVDVRQERGDGPAVGARYFQQRKTDSHHTAITGMDPGESLTVETVEGAPVFRRHIELRQTRRGTRLIDSWDLTTGYPAALELFAVRRIRRAVASNLEKLKQLLEEGTVELQDGRRVSVGSRAATGAFPFDPAGRFLPISPKVVPRNTHVNRPSAGKSVLLVYGQWIRADHDLRTRIASKSRRSAKERAMLTTVNTAPTRRKVKLFHGLIGLFTKPMQS